MKWRTMKWRTIKWCTSLKTLSNSRAPAARRDEKVDPDALRHLRLERGRDPRGAQVSSSRKHAIKSVLLTLYSVKECLIDTI